MKYEVYKFRELTKEELKKEQKKEDKAKKKNKEYITQKQIREKIENIVAFNWSDDINLMRTSFDFETNEELPIGSFIELYNYTEKKSIFLAKIEKKTSSEKNVYKYEGSDYKHKLKGTF